MSSDDHRPIPMRLTCPACGALHIDKGEFAERPHHTHACQKCGMVWRPAIVPTVGVRFLPGFKNRASHRSPIIDTDDEALARLMLDAGVSKGKVKQIIASLKRTNA